MKSNCNWILSVLIFMINICVSFSQDIDPSEKMNFKDLKDSIITSFGSGNEKVSRFYTYRYIKKARSIKDTTKIMRGLYFLSQINAKNDSVIFYSKAILDFSKKTANNYFTSLGYLNMGNYYYEKRDFNKALDNYLLTKKHTDQNSRLNYIVGQNIGLIKNRIGDFESAVIIFEENWRYVNENNFEKNDPQNYLGALLALADSYVRLKKLDSASIYNRLGVQKSLIIGDKKNSHNFILNEGINNYYKKNYTKTIDSINGVIPYFDKDLSNLIAAHFYLGKAQEARNQVQKALKNFEKVDSLFTLTGDIIPEARESYEYRISYYEKKGDALNQLKVIKNLIKVDSVLNKNYKYLVKTIVKEYDTSELLKEKELLIRSLKKDKKGFSFTIIVVLGLFVLSLIGLFIYYNKQRIYKIRFEELLHKKEESKPQKVLSRSQSEISTEVTDHILDKLHEFETQKKFLSSGINNTKLAAGFDTNPKYLSKIISNYKGKSFTNYINDLRIDEAIKKIKEEKKFRNYTIRAIAQEVGFSTAESFSKAFFSKTKLYPSFYIKEIKKTNNE